MTIALDNERWTGEPGWPRPKRVPLGPPARARMAPACFVQADPADPLSAEPERLQSCFTDFLCQVCGEPVLSIDDCGWLLSPAANMGGACCTRCMYLAARVCPHISDLPEDAWGLWAVTSWEDYEWHAVDGTTRGKVVPRTNRAERWTWARFIEHRAATQPPTPPRLGP